MAGRRKTAGGRVRPGERGLFASGGRGPGTGQG